MSRLLCMDNSVARLLLSREIDYLGILPSREITDLYFLYSRLCWGKATVACTKPQQWKKEEIEKLRGE